MGALRAAQFLHVASPFRQQLLLALVPMCRELEAPTTSGLWLVPLFAFLLSPPFLFSPLRLLAPPCSLVYICSSCPCPLTHARGSVRNPAVSSLNCRSIIPNQPLFCLLSRRRRSRQRSLRRRRPRRRRPPPLYPFVLGGSNTVSSLALPSPTYSPPSLVSFSSPSLASSPLLVPLWCLAHLCSFHLPLFDAQTPAVCSLWAFA